MNPILTNESHNWTFLVTLIFFHRGGENGVLLIFTLEMIETEGQRASNVVFRMCLCKRRAVCLRGPQRAAQRDV